ncbi:MAG: FecR family protein [Mucilaginibacter sp.]|nr:FecR family protein [Mucilaginibacter sp.]
MLDKYCKVEDFLLDDSFVEWVLGSSNDLDSYWESFLFDNPECEDNLNAAKRIILSFKIEPVNDLSQSEINQIINNIKIKCCFEDGIVNIAPQKNKVRINYLPRFDLFRYAAIITAAIGLLWYSYNTYTNTDAVKVLKTKQVKASSSFHQVINETSRTMLIKLPDHSSVILKPYAQLTYPEKFAAKKREVTLVGEAFFEISKNPNRPFYVYSKELVVRVVGTSFVVKAYKGDDQFKVIVSTGKVALSAQANKNGALANLKTILLKPNEKGVLYRNQMRLEKILLKKPLLLSEELTRINFYFVATPFSKVVSAIENAYGVQIIYNEKIMGNCLLTASLIDQSLDERLMLICKAVEADYKIIDGDIVIEGKGCNN